MFQSIEIVFPPRLHPLPLKFVFVECSCCHFPGCYLSFLGGLYPRLLSHRLKMLRSRPLCLSAAVSQQGSSILGSCPQFPLPRRVVHFRLGCLSRRPRTRLHLSPTPIRENMFSYFRCFARPFFPRACWCQMARMSSFFFWGGNSPTTGSLSLPGRVIEPTSRIPSSSHFKELPVMMCPQCLATFILFRGPWMPLSILRDSCNSLSIGGGPRPSADIQLGSSTLFVAFPPPLLQLPQGNLTEANVVEQQGRTLPTRTPFRDIRNTWQPLKSHGFFCGRTNLLRSSIFLCPPPTVTQPYVAGCFHLPNTFPNKYNRGRFSGPVLWI